LRISPADFNLEIAQARANIRAAQARLAEFAVTEESLKAALAIENEALDLANRDFERIRELSVSGTVSPATLDAKKTGVLAQKQKVQNLENSIALLPTQRAVQNEQIAVYEAGLETAKLKLQRTEITLPFAARVSSSTLEVGEFVRPLLIAAEFDGVGAAEVNTQVSAGDLLDTLFVSAKTDGPAGGIGPSKLTDSLKEFGLSATVRLKVGQRVLEWPATVDRISDTVDQKAGTIGVIVRVDSAYSSARPGTRPPLTKGMFVEVVLSARPETGIVIPRIALRNGQVLIAGDDNRLALLPVKPLLVQNAIALITQGLEEGQRVVVMRLLRAGIDTSVIALWLGHEQIETTQIYLHADLQIKERALERTAPITTKPGRFRPTDKLLAFLEAL
jgi:membrane fusion protein, multidrug efflux system